MCACRLNRKLLPLKRLNNNNTLSNIDKTVPLIEISNHMYNLKIHAGDITFDNKQYNTNGETTNIKRNPQWESTVFDQCQFGTCISNASASLVLYNQKSSDLPLEKKIPSRLASQFKSNCISISANPNISNNNVNTYKNFLRTIDNDAIYNEYYQSGAWLSTVAFSLMLGLPNEETWKYMKPCTTLSENPNFKSPEKEFNPMIQRDYTINDDDIFTNGFDLLCLSSGNIYS